MGVRFAPYNKSKPKSDKRKMYKPPSANVERSLLFWWASATQEQYPELEMLYHIPEMMPHQKGSSVIEQHNLHITGFRRGVPDVCLPVAKDGYHGLYIWMKQRNGRATALNKAWIDRLNEQGYKAVMCKGFVEAKQVIMDYLGIADDTPAPSVDRGEIYG